MAPLNLFYIISAFLFFQLVKSESLSSLSGPTARNGSIKQLTNATDSKPALFNQSTLAAGHLAGKLYGYKRVYGPLSTFERDSAHFCDHQGYFNPMHWSESGAAEAYLEWSILIDKNSKPWQERISEPNFFMRDVLNWSDMDCGTAYQGCVQMPSCDEILARVQNKRFARQIYFTVLSMNNINLISGVVSDQSRPAQMNVASMASDIAHNFFWKHDDGIEHLCKMQWAIIKSFIAATTTMFLMLLPLNTLAVEFAGATILAQEEVTAAETVAKEAAILAETTAEAAKVAEAEEAAIIGESAALRESRNVLRAKADKAQMEAIVAKNDVVKARIQAAKVANSNKHRFTSEGFTKNGVRPPWSFARLTATRKKFFSKIASPEVAAVTFAWNPMPMNVKGAEWEEKWCSLFPNVPKGAEHLHNIQVDRFIQQAGHDFRYRIQDDLADINKGVGFGENCAFLPFDGTVLADQIFGGDFVALSAAEHFRFVDEPIRIENDLTTRFKNGLISTILRDQMCYLHCTPAKAKSTSDRSSASLFSPQPGVLCQAQCWRNWRRGKNIQLFGLEQFVQPQYQSDLELQGFLNASFMHWQEYRLNQEFDVLFPTIDDLIDDKVSSTSGSFLPVCYSEFMAPQNFELRGHMNDRALPCICGNSFGNETMTFFREAGFDTWVAAGKGQGLATACQESMTNLAAPPVQTFLALCQLGWHFPLKTDSHHHQVQRGKDQHCDAVAAEAKDIIDGGGSSWDLNCKICYTSKTGEAIKNSQLEYYDRKDVSWYNFAMACLLYDSNTSCFF